MYISSNRPVLIQATEIFDLKTKTAAIIYKYFFEILRINHSRRELIMNKLLLKVIWRGTDDIRIPRIFNCQSAHREVFTASSSEIAIGSVVVMDTSFGKHSVVFKLGPPINKKSQSEMPIDTPTHRNSKNFTYLSGGVLLAIMISLASLRRRLRSVWR